MNKEQAIQKIANHLELLTDYDVLQVNLAETLFTYISEIVEQIDETDDSDDPLNNLINIWDNIKETKGEDFDTP